ncbi:AmmeMemoRadiSam system radical SAM enzyme [candidate division KSB1 bacterium]|nr:AmmeMemoRadiSam system radical SAM enzyme [candidate division KSB1 bacterium]
MKQALFYDKEVGYVKCELCPHFCKIRPGQTGICGVRKNQDGILYSLVYGRIVAANADPIEKKPLFHVYPGSRSFSIATVGCNFSCKFCQNHDISQMPRGKNGRIAGQHTTASQIVLAAGRAACKTIACTYTEPTIYFEFALDIAREAQEQGIHTVLVTNGYINKEPLKELAPFVSAANVDLKGWDENFYKNIIGGDLKSVLEAIVLLKKLGIWVELTTLVVPGFVDNENTLSEIARFIVKECGVETPWHISRFYPHFQYTDLPPTDTRILLLGKEIGRAEGLRYVYTGNMPGENGENTNCYQCDTLLVKRYGFHIEKNTLKNGCCPSCGAVIDGVGM